MFPSSNRKLSRRVPKARTSPPCILSFTTSCIPSSLYSSCCEHLFLDLSTFGEKKLHNHQHHHHHHHHLHLHLLPLLLLSNSLKSTVQRHYFLVATILLFFQSTKSTIAQVRTRLKRHLRSVRKRGKAKVALSWLGSNSLELDPTFLSLCFHPLDLSFLRNYKVFRLSSLSSLSSY